MPLLRQEGEEVRTGLGLLDVVAEGTMRVRAKLNQADLSGLRVGLPADIVLDAYPTRRFRGRLARIAPVATPGMSDKVRSVLATVTLDARDPILPPDLSAAVDVQLGRWTQAMTVPRDAIAWRDGRPGVVVDGRWRTIDLEALTPTHAVIRSGLSAGERVTVTGEARS